ncbi:FG-GAP repeat protein [Streptomyces glaucus]|uniref:Uncharacterized protein n=1 Tax=Streptomyces glaucus TaxID=284029 RepID=A0ABP5WT90_9ACTN
MSRPFRSPLPGTRRAALVAATALLAALAALAAALPARAEAAPAGSRPDFDGDGCAGLAAAAPAATVGGRKGAGCVAVVHGLPSGLRTRTRQAFSQNTPGVPGTAQKGDLSGRGTRLGDTNRDGRADLAVGAPGENAGAGSVRTFRSGPAAVVTSGAGTAVPGRTVLGAAGTGARLGLGFAY